MGAADLELILQWIDKSGWPALTGKQVRGLCKEASEELIKAHGGVLELLHLNSSKTQGIYPVLPVGHYVVRYDNLRIDLTAKQFNEALPCPYIWFLCSD